MADTTENPSISTVPTIQGETNTVKSTHVSDAQIDQPSPAVQGGKRRRMRFDEAKAATFTQFDETFRRLADSG